MTNTNLKTIIPLFLFALLLGTVLILNNNRLDTKNYQAMLQGEPSPIVGDVNEDNHVNIQDALVISKHFFNIEQLENQAFINGSKLTYPLDEINLVDVITLSKCSIKNNCQSYEILPQLESIYLNGSEVSDDIITIYGEESFSFDLEIDISDNLLAGSASDLAEIFLVNSLGTEISINTNNTEITHINNIWYYNFGTIVINPENVSLGEYKLNFIVQDSDFNVTKYNDITLFSYEEETIPELETIGILAITQTDLQDQVSHSTDSGEEGRWWNEGGNIDAIKSRLDATIETIDQLASENKNTQLVILPEFLVSLGNQPIEIENTLDGNYEIIVDNNKPGYEISLILRDFIHALANRKISAAIQTIVREMGAEPNYPNLWVYYPSIGLFSSYTGKIFDYSLKHRILRQADDSALNLNVENNPFIEIPIYGLEKKIPILYVICAQRISEEFANLASQVAPEEKYKLLLFPSWGPAGASISADIGKIQDRTYDHIRPLNEWNTYNADLAGNLALFAPTLQNNAYIIEANIGLAPIYNWNLGAIQANFDPLPRYEYRNNYFFWTEINL